MLGAPNTIPFRETLERGLRINCYWCKYFEIPWVNEDDRLSEERAVVDYFLTHFEEEYLNLKCIVGVKFEAAKTHLGDH